MRVFKVFRDVDGTELVVLEHDDQASLFLSDGGSARVVSFDARIGWAIGRFLFWRWVVSLFGVRLWLWRRRNQPKLQHEQTQPVQEVSQ